MDSRVTLALMSKAKLVFEQPDTPLSFAVPPFALSVREMRAVAGELSDAADASAAFEFARLVNQQATVPILSSTADTMLWSVYDDILHRSGQVARAVQSDAEKAEFRAAEQVLFSVDEQGLRVPSERAKVYAQYRDTWFTLQQAYRGRKVAAGSSSAAEATRAAWTRDEPTLRAEIATLEADWAARGFRDEYERAQATIAGLGAKDPVLQWDRWARNFDFFLDSSVDLSSQTAFCPTTYSPSDVVDSAGWIEFRLGASEIDQLIKEAPDELRVRLDQAAPATTISSVSFACTTVGVKRPWLDEQIFRSRIWRFTDQARRLSDGGSPPRGEWPYYVAGLVLARNVAVVTSPVVTPAPDSTGGGPPIVRDHRYETVETRPVMVGRPRPDGPGRPVIRDHRRAAMMAPAVAFVGPPVSEPMAVADAVDRRLVASARPVAMPSAAAMARLRAAQIQRMQSPAAPAAGIQAIAPMSLTDEVLLLALICKPLSVSACPNPDPALFGS